MPRVKRCLSEKVYVHIDVIGLATRAPSLSQHLINLLDKAEMHAATRNIKAAALLEARLYPDMFPLIGQVQLACDFAKGAVARLAGVENPSFADDETNFTQLHARIDRTLEFINSVEFHKDRRVGGARRFPEVRQARSFRGRAGLPRRFRYPELPVPRDCNLCPAAP